MILSRDLRSSNFVGCRYYGLKPDIKVISPWREWDLTSRSTLIQYAESRGIEVPSSKRGEPPFSMDANLLHISYEGQVCLWHCWATLFPKNGSKHADNLHMCRNALEDPWVEPGEQMFTRSVSPEQAPDKPTYIEIDFEKGDPVAIDDGRLSPATLLAQLNKVSLACTPQLRLPAGWSVQIICCCPGTGGWSKRHRAH